MELNPRPWPEDSEPLWDQWYEWFIGHDDDQRAFILRGMFDHHRDIHRVLERAVGPDAAPRGTVEAILGAAQEFVSAGADSPTMVTSAILVWEQVRPEGENDMRRTDYAVLTENGLSTSVGLVELARLRLRADLGRMIGSCGEDE